MPHERPRVPNVFFLTDLPIGFIKKMHSLIINTDGYNINFLTRITQYIIK